MEASVIPTDHSHVVWCVGVFRDLKLETNRWKTSKETTRSTPALTPIKATATVNRVVTRRRDL